MLAMMVAVVAVLYFTPLPGISLYSDLIRWLDLSALRKLNESLLFNFFLPAVSSRVGNERAQLV